MNADKIKTWWRHPETGRRVVVDCVRIPRVGDVYLGQKQQKEDGTVLVKRNAYVNSNRRVLRPAKVCRAGLWEWWVETGEFRKPGPGDTYLSNVGTVRYVHPWQVCIGSYPILEFLPRDEWERHGVVPAGQLLPWSSFYVSTKPRTGTKDDTAPAEEEQPVDPEGDARYWRERAEQTARRADETARRAEKAEAEAERMRSERNDALDEMEELVRAESVHVVFDGPPGAESGRFVECENSDGASISAGKWEQRGDYWHLVIPRSTTEPVRVTGKGMERAKTMARERFWYVDGSVMDNAVEHILEVALNPEGQVSGDD